MNHKNATSSKYGSEPLSTKGFVAFGSASGTMPIVWFTAECINIVSSRLPLVCAYSQAIATDRAVSPSTQIGKDCPYVSAPGRKKRADASKPRSVPTARSRVRIQNGLPDVEAHSRATQSPRLPLRGRQDDRNYDDVPRFIAEARP